MKLVEQLCQRLRVPNEIRDLARLVAEFHDLIHTFPMLNPKTIVKLFDSIDAWRKPQRVEQLALTSEADVRGRTGFESADYPQGRWLREAWKWRSQCRQKRSLKRDLKVWRFARS